MRLASTWRTQTYETRRSRAFWNRWPPSVSLPTRPSLRASRSTRPRSSGIGGSITRKRLGRLTAPTRPPIFPPLDRAEGNIPMSLEFSAPAKQKIATLCERYPDAGSKQPVVMAALHIAQKEFGHLSDD